MNQRTYVMLKPDALHRKLMGRIISRIEDKGWHITQMKMMTLTEDILREHYAALADKPFFANIVETMTTGPVVGMIVEGDSVIEGMRILIGSTRWYEALPGTIRGDFANNTTCNLIHASDSVDSADMEIKRFFGE